MFYIFIISVRNVNNLSAIVRGQTFNICTNCLKRTVIPVIPVNDIVRAIGVYNLIIHDIFLNNDAAYTGKCTNQLHSFFKRNGGKLVVTDHCFIRQNACNHFAVFLRFMYNVEMPFVDDIRCKTSVYNFHTIIPHFSSLVNGL